MASIEPHEVTVPQTQERPASEKALRSTCGAKLK
jgi:hypothetical protein